MASQSDLLERYLLDRYRIPGTQLHEHHVLHVRYIKDPSRDWGKVKVEEHWNQVREIGSGSFGDVWLQKFNTKTRAVKILRKGLLLRQRIDYKRELEALAKFEDNSQDWQEDAIIKFLGWFESDDKVFLAMEYFELGDLSLYISTGEIQEQDAKDITTNLLQALKIIHGAGFTHRDLKPQNVFVVSKSPKWWVKIGDFGITKRVGKDQTALRTETGTPLFMAPEISPDDYEEEDIEYTNSVDMWSLGCVVYNILGRRPPFANRRAKRLPFPKEPLAGRTGPAGISFMETLLVLNPAQRASAGDALKDSWFRSVNTEQTSRPSAQQTQTAPSRLSKDSMTVVGDSNESSGQATITQSKLGQIRANSTGVALSVAPPPLPPRIHISSDKTPDAASAQGDSSIDSHLTGKTSEKSLNKIPVPIPLRHRKSAPSAMADDILSKMDLVPTSEKDVESSSLTQTLVTEEEEAPSPDVKLNRVFKDMLFIKTKQNRKLLSAADDGKIEEVRQALDDGANINTRGYTSLSALDRAALFGHLDTMELLLDRGADMREGDASTALSSAAGKGFDACVSLLLDRGDLINAKDWGGNTALHVASKEGRESTVKLLLERGAAIEHTNSSKENALAIAQKKGHLNIAGMIEEAAAARVEARNEAEVASNQLTLPRYETRDDTGRLASHQDYYSDDVIHEGDIVATLWPYTPQGNDEFALGRGNLLKVRAIWDDGWCIGSRVDGDAENSKEKHLIWAKETKAFPIVVTCLLRHWKANISIEANKLVSKAMHNGPESPRTAAAISGGSYSSPQTAEDRAASIKGRAEQRMAERLAAFGLQPSISKSSPAKPLQNEAPSETSTPGPIGTIIQRSASQTSSQTGQSSEDRGAMIKQRAEQLMAERLAALGHKPPISSSTPVKPSQNEAPSESSTSEPSEVPPQKSASQSSSQTGQSSSPKLGWLASYNINLSLRKACESGDVSKMQEAIAAGADVNTRNTKGLTALGRATEKGHIDAVRLLLEYGARVDDDNFLRGTCLHIAAARDLVDILELLLAKKPNLEAQAYITKTPLHEAAAVDAVNTIRLLIKHGANIEAKDVNAETPLIRAIEKGHFAAVDVLIEFGADVQSAILSGYYEGQTPLHKACLTYSHKVVWRLLGAGAVANVTNKKQETPLHLAAEQGTVRIVDQLLAKDTSVLDKLDSEHHTPWDKAVAKKHQEVARMIVDAGFTPNLPPGFTLLNGTPVKMSGTT